LKRGIYVDASVPCKGASNADTLSYWGGKNGINQSKLGCVIKHLTRKDGTYTLRRTCKSIYDERTFEDRVSVNVLYREAFILRRPRLPWVPASTYRYCGP